ncbi:hypothetical protein KCTC52924_02398 [Arenibacter antarcticus]|uniref:DUF1684 domain-containing protein n=1 Tax=Arenibacter antarcticus TaxID=2040469 RepID=A0ABW5VKN2_9FLAO|nr:DUF1684 domain-containing protein [Arenibacter sp. H213]MCM4168706.1 DUF1684 domain-containing protein [Arenibacter sp. H213]
MWRLTLISIICLLGCKESKKYHDTQHTSELVANAGELTDVFQFQDKLNREFKNPETSPLPDRYRKNFTSLDFFVPDSTYRITAKFTRTPEALPFFMPTTTGGKTEELVYAIINFQLNGKEHELEVYQNTELIQQAQYKDYLFLPFSDLTNGEETYGGGRYLDLRIPEGNTIVLDFNKAYNPYCAYNAKYSCPVVPKQNRLDTHISAGVKTFSN